MLKNADITVITERDGEYYLQYFSGVSFVGRTAKTVTESGLKSADYFTIRIPTANAEDIFVTASEWKTAPLISAPLQTEDGDILETEDGEPLETEGEDVWSLIPQNTIIVIGTIDCKELENYTKFLSTHEWYAVMSVSDNRNGSPSLQHIRCDCK